MEFEIQRVKAERSEIAHRRREVTKAESEQQRLRVRKRGKQRKKKIEEAREKALLESLQENQPLVLERKESILLRERRPSILQRLHVSEDLTESAEEHGNTDECHAPLAKVKLKM